VPGQVVFKLKDGTWVGDAFTHLLFSRVTSEDTTSVPYS
jgi:hypothetical protein